MLKQNMYYGALCFQPLSDPCCSAATAAWALTPSARSSSSAGSPRDIPRKKKSTAQSASTDRFDGNGSRELKQNDACDWAVICATEIKDKAKPLWNLRFQRGFVRAVGLSRGLLGQRRSNLVLHAEGKKRHSNLVLHHCLIQMPLPGHLFMPFYTIYNSTDF